MDKNRFKELFTDTDRWVRQARRLKIAGDYLIPMVVRAFRDWQHDKEGLAKQSPEFLEKAEIFRSLTDARALLYGLCIENACKARSIQDGRVQVIDGVAKNLRSDHNLLEMVKEAGYKPTKEESEFLELLAYQTTTLAKYPIAKNLVGQNRFTGRTVGARPEESQMTEQIAVAVLHDEILTSVFLRGYPKDENPEQSDRHDS